MRQIKIFTILACTVALGACATPAPAPAPAPEVVAAHTVPAAKTVDGNSFKLPAGYTRVLFRDGVERFCRNDLTTGSRTEHDMVCLTAAELQAQEARTRDQISTYQQNGAHYGGEYGETIH
ncbi:MAG: hypothetical protein WDM77_16685 [Steroidobacteraceae bacterium]